VGVKFAGEHDGAEAEILDEHQMEALGMGSLLAVARGSANRPRLVVLKWTGADDAKPYVLVGKGITFDTGGVNLKTQGGIEEMKYDMCGGANVIGTFVAAVKAKLPLNLVVVLPTSMVLPDIEVITSDGR
jgi:leucyl aminopeptidase